MSTQARMPATLPTPAAARSQLRLARDDARAKRNTYDDLKERLAAARDEMKTAGAEVEEAEGDMLVADADSAEEKAASNAHQKAWQRMRRAELDYDKVKATRGNAQHELKKALALLATAREELEAVREGRRR